MYWLLSEKQEKNPLKVWALFHIHKKEVLYLFCNYLSYLVRELGWAWRLYLRKFMDTINILFLHNYLAK